MKRRDFLRNSSLGILGVGFASRATEFWLGKGSVSASLSALQSSSTDKVVITVNLLGGNDGLNTVIPLSQYDRYRKLRPKLAIDSKLLQPLPNSPNLALNPSMSELSKVYSRGKVAIVTGVGLPRNAKGLFDHEASQLGFQSAKIDGLIAGTGWVGRYLDTVEGGLISPGVDFGGGVTLLRGGNRQPLAISKIEEFNLVSFYDQQEQLEAYARLVEVADKRSESGEFSRQQRKLGLEQSAIVQERAGKYQPKVTYPKTSLAESLQQCAALISADLGVRALSVGLGGFDTHSKQNMSREVGGLGFHDNLLKQVSDAVSAFYTDAEAQGFADRIVVLIFSEFGRTPNENGDQGTDHGYASVMFVVGGSVKGGVYGEYPSLDQSKLFIDNLDVNTDFRSVYSTLLANHLSVDPEQVLGSKFSTLSFI